MYTHSLVYTATDPVGQPHYFCAKSASTTPASVIQTSVHSVVSAMEPSMSVLQKSNSPYHDSLACIIIIHYNINHSRFWPCKPSCLLSRFSLRAPDHPPFLTFGTQGLYPCVCVCVCLCSCIQIEFGTTGTQTTSCSYSMKGSPC